MLPALDLCDPPTVEPGGARLLPITDPDGAWLPPAPLFFEPIALLYLDDIAGSASAPSICSSPGSSPGVCETLDFCDTLDFWDLCSGAFDFYDGTWDFFESACDL